jgi:L-ascorbate metabolism protein UlaG (beta-lactamase superfamily)
MTGRRSLVAIMRRTGMRGAWAVVAVVAIVACIAGFAADDDVVPDPRFGHAPFHDGQYANLGPFRLPTWGDLADWYWHWWRDGGTQPPPGGYGAVPVDRTDLAYLAANRRDTTVTWIGHASVLLQLAGRNLLMDPMFSKRAFFVDFAGPERKVPAPFPVEATPPIDVVMISHNHYDHLDAASVDALAKQPDGGPLFIVPKGVDDWMRRRGITRVVGLDWWDARELPPTADGDHLRITMVPAAHWSARSPFDRFETLWGGYVVERMAPDGAVRWRYYFAGDTGYAPLFHDLIHARFPSFDFAAIPIGAYEPNRYLHAQHVTPAEAVRIHRELDVRQSFGIHWGTFLLTTEPFDQPPKDLAAALVEAGLPPDGFVTFRHGETRVLQRFETSPPENPRR